MRTLAHYGEVEIRFRGGVAGRVASDQRHRQRAPGCERTGEPLCNRLRLERGVVPRTHPATVAPLPDVDDLRFER